MSKPGQKSEQSSAARTDHSELARGWRVVRFLPILEWLPRYGRDDIAGDLMAGAVVAIMLVPQSMAYAMLAGLPPPLSPIMLLFLNLVSDGAPALALGMEKGEPGIMDRPPRPVGEPIINREMLIGIAVQSVVMTVAILSSYLLAGARPGAALDHPDLPMWRTVAFATLTLSELLRAFTARSERISVFKLGVFGNKTMNLAVIFSIVLVIAVIYVPFLQFIFGTVPLALVDWLWILPFALMASIAAEITKIYLRARARRIETSLTAQMEMA
jgi:Ca2+-transporting ATPase